MREGLRKRSQKIKQKALNYKGFGERIKGEIRWYSIEYNRETKEDCDLIELHWIKVKCLDKHHKKIIREVMEDSGYAATGLREEDFLATIYMAIMMSSDRAPINANAAFLFPANHKGDCTIRKAIAGAYGHLDFEETLLGFCFASVEIDEIIPSCQISLVNRRLKR